MKGIFVSGSGTDVGKTYVALRLIKILNNSHTVKARKPIESDCTMSLSGLTPKDATLLAEACNSKEPAEKVCSFRFEGCSSPEKASEEEGAKITLDMLVSACQTQEESDYVVVEGAGGLYSPIAHRSLNIDLVKELKLPIVLVVRDELGAINQALLVVEAAKKQETVVAVIVLNQKIPNNLDNKKAIERYTDVPVVVLNNRDLEGFDAKVRELI